ncbi:uncharacterized protein LOC105795916 [Gossypium raimondii]|uniref:uncharacterized protein LOC105795916 n=1 Tax=Gossypium raimondii TaxID=29730 RepID=UPI00063AD3AA|nr:uncharacterized protein LOC105795916 [Gossypium raimondii]
MCAFLNHVGQYPCSLHNNAEKIFQDLLNQSWHIDKVINAQSLDENEAITLKDEICVGLSRHFLDVQNIQGQGYDGARNMRGEWNSLQALFLNDCPYAYYVHYLALKSASCKCHDQLQVAQAIGIANMLVIDELEIGKGLNQIGTVKRARETHWSSHFCSVCSLIRMFDATCYVLANVIENGSNYFIRGDSATTYKKITSFYYVFILDLVKEIMGIIDILCQHLQQKSQDIVNAMYLVLSTKTMIQKLRENGWGNLLEVVEAFFEKHNIKTIDLLTLSSALDPNDAYNPSIWMIFFVLWANIILLISQRLEETQMSKVYFLVDRLICILFTLPTLTTSTEIAFSTMKNVKTRLSNKMEDEFLTDNPVIYIEREIAETFDSDSIFSDFISLKERRA